jgi:hypothetical protein
MFRTTLAMLMFTITAVPALAQAVSVAAAEMNQDPEQNGEAHASGLGVLDRPAHIMIEDLPLSEGLALLRKETGVPLAFSPSRMEEVGKVSCRCEDVTIREALERMLSETTFRFVEAGKRVIVERHPYMSAPLAATPPQRPTESVRLPRLRPAITDDRDALGL